MATLLSAATATGAGSTVGIQAGFQSVIGYGTTSSGAGSATVNIEVCHDPSVGAWVTAGTLTLVLGSTMGAGVFDGLSLISGWRAIRANVIAISGTGAAVTVVV